MKCLGFNCFDHNGCGAPSKIEINKRKFMTSLVTPFAQRFLFRFQDICNEAVAVHSSLMR